MKPSLVVLIILCVSAFISRSARSALSLGVFFLLALLGSGSLREAQSQDTQPITLTEIDGRSWLVDSEGQLFFAHGITHANNKSAKLDFPAFSRACKELGFNAYGYGCPPDLKSDMPYLESWSHLVESAYCRGKDKVKFVDIFDPAEQARL